MQILKQETREKIIRSARKEFKKNGYRRASMRTISVSADMTVGNLYRYYRNKEALFGAIIEPLKNALEELKARTIEPIPDIRSLLIKIRELQAAFTEEWSILYHGAKGTRFEKSVRRFEEGLQEVFSRILVRNGRPRELARPITAAVLTGLSVITGHDGKDDVALSFIDSMVLAVS